MKLEEAVKLMRATDVKRWTIIPVTREQSVAEHSYRVWALALSLYDHLLPVPHNSFERESVAFWALTHDSDEIWTGDIPSSVKKLIEALAPGLLKNLKERVLGDNVPQVASSLRGIENTFPARIVKIAECVEALTFYNRHSYNSPDRETVYGYLNAQLLGALDTAAKTYSNSVDWGEARNWATEAIVRL